MIFVDSSVWIEYFNGVESLETAYLDKALDESTIVIGDFILLEVLQGFRNDKDYEIAKELLLSLDVLEMLGKDLSLKASQNYRALRARGITIRKSVDVIIATFCIEKDFRLLHADKDFQPFEKHFRLKNALSLTD